MFGYREEYQRIGEENFYHEQCNATFSHHVRALSLGCRCAQGTAASRPVCTLLVRVSRAPALAAPAAPGAVAVLLLDCWNPRESEFWRV